MLIKKKFMHRMQRNNVIKFILSRKTIKLPYKQLTVLCNNFFVDDLEQYLVNLVIFCDINNYNFNSIYTLKRLLYFYSTLLESLFCRFLKHFKK